MGDLDSFGGILGDLVARNVGTGTLEETPIAPVCPMCNGLLFVTRGQNHDRVDCACQSESVSRRRERHWLQCGFGEIHLACRLETHPLALDGVAPGLIAELTNPTDTVTPLGVVPGWRRSWFLHGSVGHGKTGLAAGFAYRFLCETGDSVCCRTVPDVLAELRATYNPRKSDDGDEPVTERD